MQVNAVWIGACPASGASAIAHPDAAAATTAGRGSGESAKASGESSVLGRKSESDHGSSSKVTIFSVRFKAGEIR